MNRVERPRDGHSGQGPRQDAGAGALTADQYRGGATIFRCGGCGTTAMYLQRERRYGRLVQGFFDRHERCGGAVEISATGPPQAQPGERASAAI